jgi:RND family efflux transporter MFP subunit
MRRFFWALVVLAGAGIWSYQKHPWEETPVSVKIEIATPGIASEVLALNGQLIPADEVSLAAAVAGQISAVAVREGDLVEAGQVLARLDDTIARASFDQSEANLELARIDAEASLAAYDRALSLGENISPSALDSARFSAEAAQARVRQLTAAVNQSRRQLELYQVVSPIGGTVLSVNAVLGQVVGSSSPLFIVGDLADPMLETEVDEVFGARIKPGLSALVAPIGSNQALKAHVSFVAPSVDLGTGGRAVRLRFDEAPVDPLPAGLTVSINVVVEKFDDVITVPRSAVHDLDIAPFLLLDVGGRVAETPVKLRDWPSNRMIVISGLSAGDHVITEPTDIAVGTLVYAESMSGPAE